MNRINTGGVDAVTNNVLVVDDELALREMLQDVLNEEGYNTEIAGSAEDALEILNNYDPDVIVSDVLMPGMDGHEFCRLVRRTSDASILMMSGVSSEFSVLQRQQIDADDFLIKPFDVENFLERIEALLAKGHISTDDDESRLLRVFRGLSQAKKEAFLKEVNEMAD